MINNIARSGTRTRVVDAAMRQFRRLNTNSRFLYDSMTRYAERIVELLPAELDSVLLRQLRQRGRRSGPATRRRFTGRRDVVALAGAYHGWTGAVSTCRTSPMDRPNWRDRAAAWAHVAEQPDTYRGAYGTDARHTARRCVPSRGRPRAARPRSSANRCSATRAVWNCRPASCAASTTMSAPRADCASPTRCRSAWPAPVTLLGLRARGGRARHRVHRQGDRQRPSARRRGRAAARSPTVSTADVLLLLDRRRTGVVRDRHRRARRDPRRGAAGERPRSSARTCGDECSSWRAAPLIGAVHGRGLYQGIDLVLDRETPRAGATRPWRSASGCANTA